MHPMTVHHRCWRPLAGVLLLGGCAAMPEHGPEPAAGSPTGTVRYACEDGTRLRVRLQEDAAQLEGLPGGPDALLRDAGGLTPRQRVYAGPRVRAEFGLGPDGTQAVLQLLQPQPATLRCARG